MEDKYYIKLFEDYILRKTTPEEEAILDAWIKTNPRISSHFKKSIEKSSNEIDPAIARRNLNVINKLIKQSDNREKRRFKLPTFVKVAATLLLPILSATIVYLAMTDNFIINPNDQINLSVLKGQKVQVKLPDSTLVWLNANSTLSYNKEYNQNNRDIILKGEAFFDVAKNEELTFRVDVKDMIVEAIGTAFVIKAYPEDNTIYTVLKEGKVKIDSPIGETILEPNTCFTYNKKANRYSKTNIYNADDYIVWISNKLRFENATFEQIVKDLERIYAIDIVVENNNLLERRFTGSVPNSSIDVILNSIKYILPFDYTIKDQKIIIK